MPKSQISCIFKRRYAISKTVVPENNLKYAFTGSEAYKHVQENAVFSQKDTLAEDYPYPDMVLFALLKTPEISLK